MRSLDILNNIQVASPCDADWKDMRGDDQVRHCLLCDRNVYNLSALTADDAVKLIEETEGRLCGRFYRRADGTVMTADCPVGIRAALMRAQRSTLRALAMVISFAITGALFLLARGQNPLTRSGCVTRAVQTVERWTETQGGVVMGEMPAPEHVMGKMAVPEQGAMEMGDVAIAE
jgi:hypothetical protein